MGLPSGPVSSWVLRSDHPAQFFIHRAMAATACRELLVPILMRLSISLDVTRARPNSSSALYSFWRTSVVMSRTPAITVGLRPAAIMFSTSVDDRAVGLWGGFLRAILLISPAPVWVQDGL